MRSRLVVIGLDCATPQLVFDQYREQLPTLSGLMDRGCYCLLRSSDPPITVPAWTSMTTGLTAGRLGLYGFRNRQDYSYGELRISTNADVRAERIWETLSKKGLASVVLGVPQTYPPRAFNGWLVSSFLAPGIQSDFTYPASLKNEIFRTQQSYIIDVRDFRSCEKSHLLRQIYEMTELRFRLARHLLQTKPWHFFMMVEMGVDRLQHSFWRHCDPSHPQFVSENPYQDTILNYYKHLDAEIARLLSLLPARTPVFIVSDHGAQALQGGICLNQWLVDHRYLVLKENPGEATPFSMDLVDWDNTRAWGEGGYYGRIFLNVRGREPNGTVAASDYRGLRLELKQRIEAMRFSDGDLVHNTVIVPEEIYPEVQGFPPDLMVYFGNLRWRSVGMVGMGNVFTETNDTGPDDANHAQHGIFIAADYPGQPRGQTREWSVQDITPTVLKYFGLRPPVELDGTAMF